jgi:hypothetical protein
VLKHKDIRATFAVMLKGTRISKSPRTFYPYPIEEPCMPARAIDKTTTSYHATGMASKAVGNTYGVAQRASLIGVTLPEDIDVRPSVFIDMLWKVWEDVGTIRQQDNGRRARFVVAMSFEWQPADQAILNRILRFMKKLAGIGDVVIVLATGNCRVFDPSFDCVVSTRFEPSDRFRVKERTQKTNLSQQQTSGEDPLDAITRLTITDPIFGVGSVNNDGVRSAFSQGNPAGNVLTMSAPGEDVTVADHETFDKTFVTSGTSFGKC